MPFLRTPSPGLRTDREGPLLLAGLGLGLLFSLGTWGLRLPVLAGALVPAGGALVVWQERRRQQRAPRLAAGNLLDPLVLERRLAELAGVGFPPGPQRLQWQRLGRLLEGIRGRIARCIALAPDSAVPLLVLLEGLVAQLEPVLADLHELEGALPAPVQLLLQRRINAQIDRLRTCGDQLQDLLDQALRHPHAYPGQPLELSLDSLPLLP
jgi:hypothetical protein